MDKKEQKKISWKDFGPEKIILLAAAGIFLLVSNFSFPAKEKTASVEKTQTKSESISENDQYTKQLEKNLETLLSQVKGVGKVEVMIKLKASKETILNKDSSKEESTKISEKNAQEYDSKVEEETVLSDAQGNASPYIIKEIEPEIAGVIITCEGADNNLVKSAVTDAASVLFSLPYSRIKVLKMEDDK